MFIGVNSLLSQERNPDLYESRSSYQLKLKSMKFSTEKPCVDPVVVADSKKIEKDKSETMFQGNTTWKILCFMD